MIIIVFANNDVGLYRFRRELLSELLKTNKVYISLPYGDLVEPLKEMGCQFIETPIDRRGLNPIKDFKLYLNYRKIVKQLNPDLIITYTIKPNIYAGFAGRVMKVPYAVNITGLGSAFENGGIIKKLVVLMYRIACKNSRIVFFENEENRQIFINERIVKESQTYRLFGAGVNLEEFRVSEYPQSEKLKFLFMGRVMSEKGIDELFSAMKILIKSGVDCELDVIGGYEEDYKEKIELYEKTGWLHYYGYQKDVRPYINACHCVVLPSWHEGMSNSNLESAASGRPLITTNIPGCYEAVIDGVSGYLCEKKNADDLAEKMRCFVDLSYEARKAMGIAGRKHMEDVFDKKRIVAETVQFLRGMK